MTRAEIEKELDQWNVMVHGNKEFTPNCLCKFTWETPQGVDTNQKSYEALKAFENGDAVYVNNVEVLGYSNHAFLGRDKIIPYSIVTSVTTIS